MKRILSLLVAVMMLMLCLPAMAVPTKDFDPVGYDISNVHAAYLTAGGNPSQTEFLTAEDFASHTITFINVWSNGCGPCIAEMPYFQQIHEEYGDQGVLVVGCCSLWIGGSYSGEWNYLQQNGYTYMNVIQDSVLMNLYQQNNYVPQTFIVNSAGIVIDFIGGGTNYNTLSQKIAQWVGYYSDDYYEVSFVEDVNGTVFDTQTVHAGAQPVYPAAPEITGYQFANWNPAQPPYILADTTITAHYIPKTYRVRFFDSITGDKIGPSVFVSYGSPVPEDQIPEAPEHEGYYFVGWDHDLTCVTEAMDVYTIYQEGEQPPVDPTPVPTEEPPAVQYIHEVYVYGFEAPVAGELVQDHLNLYTEDGVPYFIAYMGWLDETEQAQLWQEDAVFTAGHVVSEGCMLMSMDGYEFAEDCVFIIEGAEIDPEWSYVDEEYPYMAYINTMPVEVPGDEPTPGEPGDLNGDGEVTAADALLVLRASLGIVELTPEQEALADVNGDGTVNGQDALLVLRMSLGLAK